jgi:alpha-L-fucosidase
MNEIENQFPLAGAALMKVVRRKVQEDRRFGTVNLTTGIALALLLQAGGSLAAEHPGLALPSPQQAEWQDYEVGMFVHFAPNTWLDKEYDDLSKPLKDLNPSQLDTEQWAKVAETMGAKHIVFVAKHVGGFCWWQTDSTDYGARQIAWRGGKGDVMADLSRSCREHGLKLGVYLSPADRHFGVGVGGKAEDPAKQAGYQKVFRQQLTELLSRYGEIKEVWFDGSLVFDVGDILKQHAPGAVVFQGPQASIRWVGNENGVAPYPAWNAVKFGKKPWGGYTAEDGDPEGDRWLPNECDARMRNTWFWRTDNLHTIKTVDQLLEMYVKSVGRGAVLLLNNTPDPTGRIPEPDAQRAAEFGAEIKRRYANPVIDTAGTGSNITMMLSAPRKIDCVLTMEDITQGERVREYTVEGNVNGTWKTLVSGSAMGHKKIDPFEPVEVSELRLRISKSAAAPVIRKFAAYSTKQP